MTDRDRRSPTAPLRVALLFGGVSPEHDVSIMSAAQVAERGLAVLAARRTLDVRAVYIAPDGEWVFAPRADSGATPNAEHILAARDWPADPANDALDFPRALARLGDDETDVALLALHGRGGEDGRIQGALDMAAIAYTGSGATASAVALDKARSQAIFNAAGLPIAPSACVRPGSEWGGLERLTEVVGMPCVVKPARGGSSVGISIVESAERLKDAVEAAYAIDDEVLVERFVAGREFTCGVIERDGTLLALPVTEIVPPDGRFFDYDARYTAGVSREVTPADIPGALATQMQGLARAAHQACGCRGFSRSDFIADPGEPVLLEINTIPGLTATSLLPQAAAAVGIDFPGLIELMLDSAAHD